MRRVTKENLIAQIDRLRKIKDEQGQLSMSGEYTLQAYEMLLATMEAESVVPDDIKQTIDALAKLNNRLYRWTSCMSYNDSYVGESGGLLKSTIREMEHILDACRAAMLNQK